MVAAYTDAQKIANYLGVTLTGAQQTQAGVLAQAASDFIDKHTGKSWQLVSPITDELHTPSGDRVYLNNRPVVAVSSVKTRPAAFVGYSWTALAVGQYELVDPANGVLLIEGWQSPSDGLVQVSYTHTAVPAPSPVQLAASMIAASWLSQAMRPNTSGIDSVSVGQNDIAVKFSASRSDVPKEALTLLGAYRSIVIA